MTITTDMLGALVGPSNLFFQQIGAYSLDDYFPKNASGERLGRVRAVAPVDGGFVFLYVDVTGGLHSLPHSMLKIEAQR